MTEQERILQIEQSLAGLEKQVYNLRLELNELKESRHSDIQAPSDVMTAIADISAQPTNTVQASISAPIPDPVQDSAPSAKPAAASSASAAKAAPTQTPQKKNSASRFEENIGGKVMGIVKAHKTTKEELGLMMTGALDYKDEKSFGIAKDSQFDNEASMGGELSE